MELVQFVTVVDEFAQKVVVLVSVPAELLQLVKVQLLLLLQV
jgi:hypothetical protein